MSICNGWGTAEMEVMQHIGQQLKLGTFNYMYCIKDITFLST